MAVDPRQTSSATGAGDLYTVVTELVRPGTNILLNACTNPKLNCSSPMVISTGDPNADFSFVQVRPDGLITVSYGNLTSTGAEDIMFVTCTPNGAPAVPTCGSPQLVSVENNPALDILLGDLPMGGVLYPRHVNRQESDETTFTTFLVYDRCDVAVIQKVGEMLAFCPKTDVVVASSTDAGASWSPITKVSTSAGQQFFGAVALDTSTNTVNVGYYSTENDSFQIRPQVFLAQIALGTTTVEAPHLLTSDFGDVQASPPIVIADQPVGFGDRLGIAANGTGVSGQSRAYVGFTWDSVFGTYAGVASADVNNHLTNLQY
jgi:hypothetical protein